METTTTVTAPDIECDGCANAIKKALGTVPGVAGVDVDITAKTVTVKHDPQAAPRETITARLDKAGFPVAA
ncbi:MAG: heavy-metal-associated domain-containing protein [Armatimonadota bacterium]